MLLPALAVGTIPPMSILYRCDGERARRARAAYQCNEGGLPLYL